MCLIRTNAALIHTGQHYEDAVAVILSWQYRNFKYLASAYLFHYWLQGNETRYHLYINNYHVGDWTPPCVAIDVRKGRNRPHYI